MKLIKPNSLKRLANELQKKKISYQWGLVAESVAMLVELVQHSAIGILYSTRVPKDAVTNQIVIKYCRAVNQTI